MSNDEKSTKPKPVIIEPQDEHAGSEPATTLDEHAGSPKPTIGTKDEHAGSPKPQ
ncbi:hypothetical protein ACFWY6_20125 [Streptomyces sp. NPDC059037]|uniref:hypothetical protein n=1 Tax=Streptomyces sp. NPDC059037 TaxID=3346710 RepID=UPI003685F1D3